MTQSTDKLILDTPVPHISTPILVPTNTTKVKSLKSMAKNVYGAVRKKMNAFADWILGYVPESIKKPINEGVEALKQQVSDIFKRCYPHLQDPRNFEIRESKSALKGVTKQFTIDGKEGYDPQSFMKAVKSQVVGLLNNNRQNKFNFVLTCVMERVDMKTGEVDSSNVPFATKATVVLESTDVDDLYENSIDKIVETMTAFQMRGSNWRFASVVKLEINSFSYVPLKGKSYIKLPEKLAKKKAIINTENKDNQCFKWAVTRALNPVQRDGERITKMLRAQADKLNWNGLEFPVGLKDIDKFERNNEVSVNVFGYEINVYPLRISTKQCERIVDLLLISDGEKQHYCVIKSLSRLLSSQVSNRKWKRYFCRRCLNSYDREDKLKLHQEYCNNHEAVKIVLPKHGIR